MNIREHTGAVSQPGNRFLKKAGRLGANLGLLILSSLLFALSFPSFLTTTALFPLAFLSLVPLFIVIHRIGWIWTPLYGAFYGFVSYALFNFWLAKFHPLAIIIVPVIYMTYFIAVFPALKAADAFFPRYGYILQAFIWLSYEYLRTLGFLGYSYGIIGYSQALFLPLARISAITGVWGVSLLVVFPSAFLGNALKNGFAEFGKFVQSHWKEGAVYGAVFLAAVGYGLFSVSDLSSAKPWKVSLVQQNVDPWHGEYRAYRESLDILKRQSEKALREDPDIVVWSETSFVPGIDWHTRFRQDQMRYELVKELREFLSGTDVPFVIGNDDGQYERRWDGTFGRVDYNATILYENGEIKNTYRKTHLVPFTEYFPYEKLLPGIYTWLKNADTHFWEHGTEFTVFEAGGVKFSTPICFEDTFGYLSRAFVNHGAQVIVNMTNDSWSNSVAAMEQHFQMAIFRALENKRSVVRSTNGGITAAIDPNGNTIDRLAPFTEGYLTVTVPVYTAGTTLYTRWGDWFALFAVIVSLAGLLGGLVVRFARNGIDNRREV